MVELKARSPVWRSQQRLKGAGQVHKHVAHQEKPAGAHTRFKPRHSRETSDQTLPQENVIITSLTFTGIKARAGERPALSCDELGPETIKFGIWAILEGVVGGSGSKLLQVSHGEDGSD